MNWVEETKEGGVSGSLLSFTIPFTCMCVGRGGEDYETCGRENNPCESMKYAVERSVSLSEMKLLYSSSGHDAESEGIVFKYLELYVIEGEGGGEEESSVRVEKGVREISDGLFTLKYCENITFSSIAFIIQNSSLSHSLFFCIHAYLTLTSISITPSDSNTPTDLTQSLIVSSVGSTLTISDSAFQSVALEGGNGAVICASVGEGLSFVVINSSFTQCSAMNGGAVYVVIGSDPMMINMSEVGYSGNSASNEGNTLYVVWKSTESMRSDEFEPFMNCDEKEAKVEEKKRGIVILREYVNGGGSSEEGGECICECECESESMSGSGSGSVSEGEGKEGYRVCAQIKQEGEIGRVVVGVMEGEGESGGGGCVVGMEGGEVYVGVGEVNGEEAVVEVGDALTKVIQRCESIEIVMNVTCGGSNG